jgi:hypothetical protein
MSITLKPLRGKHTAKSVRRNSSIKNDKAAETIALLENNTDSIKRIQWEGIIREAAEKNDLKEAARILVRYKDFALGDNALEEAYKSLGKTVDSETLQDLKYLDLERRLNKLTDRELSKEKQSIAKSLSVKKGIDAGTAEQRQQRAESLQDPVNANLKVKTNIKNDFQELLPKLEDGKSPRSVKDVEDPFLFKVSEEEINSMMEDIDSDTAAVMQKFSQLYRKASLHRPAGCRGDKLDTVSKKKAEDIFKELEEIKRLNENNTAKQMTKGEAKQLAKDIQKNSKREIAEVKQQIGGLVNIIQTLQSRQLQEAELARIEREEQASFRVSQNQLKQTVLDYHEKTLSMLTIIDRKQDRKTREFKNVYGAAWFAQDLGNLLVSVTQDIYNMKSKRSLSKTWNAIKQILQTYVVAILDTISYGVTKFFSFFACFEESVVGCAVANFVKIVAVLCILGTLIYLGYMLSSPVHSFLKVICNALYATLTYLAEIVQQYFPSVCLWVSKLVQMVKELFTWSFLKGRIMCGAMAIFSVSRIMIGEFFCPIFGDGWISPLRYTCNYFFPSLAQKYGSSYIVALQKIMEDCAQSSTSSTPVGLYRPPTYFQGRLKY